jgi:polysaccharide biosynthesis protein PslF
MRIAFVSSHLPRRCGLATFSADLMAAVTSADPNAVSCHVAAIQQLHELRSNDSVVRWRIRQGKASSYEAAALAINRSDIDMVNVQHEFGLYGTWTDGEYQDHLGVFLAALRKPVTTTLHSVPPDPAPSMREAIRGAATLSDAVVVMAEAAVDVLADHYGIPQRPEVIPHGMPPIDPSRRLPMKDTLGLAGRTVLSTFGFVDPRKGLEYMIEAMPAIVASHPNALYLIAGQTHPDLRRHQGEQYRHALIQGVERFGMQRHISFIDSFMTQREIIDLLVASDIYVTPYLDPKQITSGTLAYALGAGRAIVSTNYLHAKEALADGRGILVDPKDPRQLAESVSSLLGHPDRRLSLELRSYSYAKNMTWPKAGQRWLELMRRIVSRSGYRSKRPAA